MTKKKDNNKKSESEKPEFEIGDPRRFFCDRAFILYGKEHFVIAMQTGAVVDTQYAFTPHHAKRLMKKLEEKVKEYEEKYGNLDVSLPTEE